MASSPEQSLAQESNVSRRTETGGISVNLLLFGGNLVEKAFEAAMEEIHANSDNEVVMTDKQPGDEEENKSANEPPGSSTGISNVTQTREQEKLEGDDGFDQVDAAPAIASNRRQSQIIITQPQDSHKSQPAVKEYKGTNFEGPKIEVTRSNSSSEEDSAATEEINGEQDDEEKENLKGEVNELRREKSSLEESLKEERSKIEKLTDQLRREKDELLGQLNEQSSGQGSSAVVDREKEELIAQLKHGMAQLQGRIETLTTSMKDKEKEKEEAVSRLQEANESLKNQVFLLREKVASSKEDVEQAQESAREAQQEKSTLQVKLSTAETHSSHKDNTVQKLRNDITNLQEQNKLLEKKGSEIEQRVTQEVQRKLQNRIRELEEKVIKVNEEKIKIKGDYDEAVKALEAVDKVYNARENTLAKYKADYEEATDKIKENEKEIASLKSDLSKNKEKLTRALEYKADREELKDHLRKSKEAIALQREETQQVRKDLDEERQSLKMAQARAQERGRKIQVLNLEVTEVKDTLQIARNVIDEKENNMKSLRESLKVEKEQKAKLQKELEIVPYLEKKLQYTEEEKHRLECRLQNTELELKETHTSLQQSISKRRELDQNVDNLEKDKKHLNSELEEKRGEITNLNERIKEQDQEIGAKLMEIVQMADSIDNLRDQLEDVLTSYHNDRVWWKQRADKVLGRRPKSAPPRRRPGNELPNSGMSLSSRRLMNRMGPPRLNQSFINSNRKVTRQMLAHTDEEQAPKVTTKENEDVADGNPGHLSAPETLPTPPSVPPPAKLRSKRPASSYGIRSHSPLNWSPDDGTGYYSDMSPVMEEPSINGYDADDEVFSSLAVHKGDKVMIQSKIRGEEKVNITGLVKYVGRIGSGGGSVFVGLKLDQPVGNTSGRIGGKEFFSLPVKIWQNCENVRCTCCDESQDSQLFSYQTHDI